MSGEPGDDIDPIYDVPMDDIQDFWNEGMPGSAPADDGDDDDE